MPGVATALAGTVTVARVPLVMVGLRKTLFPGATSKLTLPPQLAGLFGSQKNGLVVVRVSGNGPEPLRTAEGDTVGMKKGSGAEFPVVELVRTRLTIPGFEITLNGTLAFSV